jgi:hypothetical protein
MSEDIFRNYYGKNYEKEKAATPIEIRKMKENFRKKYPNATMSKFDFEVTFAKDGTVESRDIFFKVDNLTSYDIMSDTFRSNPEWTKFLHWVDGWRSVLPDMIFRPSKDFKMDVHSFKVYITEIESFITKLEPLNRRTISLRVPSSISCRSTAIPIPTFAPWPQPTSLRSSVEFPRIILRIIFRTHTPT